MTPAERIACKVDNFRVAAADNGGFSTVQKRRDAQNRLAAYVDCYRIVTDNFDDSWEIIIQECRHVATRLYQ